MMNLLESSDDEDVINYIEHLGRVRRPRINRRRPNNFEIWDDHDFFVRYRLQKNTVRRVLNRITNIIANPTNLNASLRPEEMLLLTLRFYATGSFLNVVGDLNGVHKATASKIVRKVSDAIASLNGEYIRFPRTNEEIQEVMGGFYDIASFPRVIGTIDCTHVKIQSPAVLHNIACDEGEEVPPVDADIEAAINAGNIIPQEQNYYHAAYNNRTRHNLIVNYFNNLDN
ncbi:hypothetical protein MML48_2g00006230 [Holotrichia oblita]|uniref:Uncharacterized protein n=1 Tax=Holotrichia oblita TaxID=644536 RepID=A0ACB9TQT7_HOLOL|nr:hypothetical protein MML48_2g00006230 [Holotrichia oblita]